MDQPVTSDPAAAVRRICRLVAARAAADEVEAELGGDGPGPWTGVRVERDGDGHVEFVHLEMEGEQLRVDDLRSVGQLEEIRVRSAGDPSSHLLIVDDADRPELCRVVIAADQGWVRALSFQPDTRL